MQNNDLDPMQVKVMGQGIQIFYHLSQMLVNEHAQRFLVIRLAVFEKPSIQIGGARRKKKNYSGEKTRKEKLFGTFMTFLRHDGAT